LPILLYGTYNRLQHLSAIANDINLAEKVNICKSLDVDKPNDLYSELVNPIKENIINLVESEKKNL
jgi:DNA-directed RNA polymerase